MRNKFMRDMHLSNKNDTVVNIMWHFSCMILYLSHSNDLRLMGNSCIYCAAQWWHLATKTIFLNYYYFFYYHYFKAWAHHSLLKEYLLLKTYIGIVKEKQPNTIYLYLTYPQWSFVRLLFWSYEYNRQSKNSEDQG